MNRPVAGTPITCLVDGHKHSGQIVRFDGNAASEPSQVIIAVADDGYTNHVSFPESSIIEPACPKCCDTGLLSDTKPRRFCECQQGRVQYDLMLDGV
jgi:hypothetical protein